MDKTADYNMYGNTYFKWCHYFLFMLLGAIMGSHPVQRKISLGMDTIKLMICVLLFYGILIFGKNGRLYMTFRLSH